jgi:hypothetical protein
MLMVLTACTPQTSEPTPDLITGGTVTSTATPTHLIPPPTPFPWDDASDVMSGLCFESVYDAAGRTYILHNTEELTQFFDLADNSHLCRHPVQRGEFDFSGDRLLVGLWTRAVGCSARHQVISVRRDDVARTYIITLRLVVESGCDYELVRPFWIGLSDVSEYDVRLLVN